MRKYKVTCLNCGEFDHLEIDEDRHIVTMWEKVLLTPFLAARWRRDLQWGFHCKCGNDNRLAKSEGGDFDKLVDGDAMSIKKIAKSLSIPDAKQFKMEQL